MDAIDQLFQSKREEAKLIVSKRRESTNPVGGDEIPFEVNKVLNQLKQETQRREKLLKRKPS